MENKTVGICHRLAIVKTSVSPQVELSRNTLQQNTISQRLSELRLRNQVNDKAYNEKEHFDCYEGYRHCLVRDPEALPLRDLFHLFAVFGKGLAQISLKILEVRFQFSE